MRKLKNYTAVFYIVKHTSACEPAIPILGIHSREMKTHVCKKIPAGLILNNKKLETTQISINRRKDKLWYIHLTKYYSAIKRRTLTHPTS